MHKPIPYFEEASLYPAPKENWLLANAHVFFGFVVVLLLALSVAFCSSAQAALPASATPGKYHEWFEGQYANGSDIINPDGTVFHFKPWCCNLADGFLLEDSEWGLSEKGQFWTKVLGVKYMVTPEQLVDPKGNPYARDKVTGGPNPTGAAVVWYVINGLDDHRTVSIYCFCPGNLY
jgi:hypothetical protein